MVNQLTSLPVSQLNRQTNKQLFREAKRYIAGGVNSPVRSFSGVGGTPIFMKRAKGSKLYSQGNREFIDYCLGWGALILGHAHPQVIKGLKNQLGQGTAFGTVTQLETQLAQLITEAVPSIDNVRLTSSGTEAVMSAIRLSRAYTRKDKIIKFQGGYHGHADYLLACPGVPRDFTRHTLILEYNNIRQAEKIVKRRQKEIAAIIVEPVCGNMGVVLPQPGFLESLRKIADKYNVVLIFDEVITGFRLSYCGAQGLFGIKPDLTCLGKIIGGGLPSAAYGGRKEIMKLVAPAGPVYQAGTLAGNPLAVIAGIATLKILKKSHPYDALREKTDRLCRQLELEAGENKIGLRVNYIGSMFSIFFTDTDVINYQAASTQNRELFRVFFQGLLKEGVYFSPCGLEANFLSTAHTNKDIEQTIKSAVKALKKIRRR